MKIVINTCFGGFGLSQKALQWLIDNKGWKVAPKDKTKKLYYPDVQKLIEEGYSLYEVESALYGPLIVLGSEGELSFRSNPDIVECVETLGKKANGISASLEVKEVNGYSLDQLEINEYDGNESLQTIPTRF